MHNWKHSVFLISTFLISNLTIAQNGAAGVERKGFMETNGKIYVVLVVVLIILLGLIYYLARLDRKITKLEKGEAL
jgi:hypothetical protein